MQHAWGTRAMEYMAGRVRMASTAPATLLALLSASSSLSSSIQGRYVPGSACRCGGVVHSISRTEAACPFQNSPALHTRLWRLGHVSKSSNADIGI